MIYAYLQCCSLHCISGCFSVYFFLLKIPENILFFSSFGSCCLPVVCMDIGRSKSDSNDTEGRGGGGGAILPVVNLEKVEGSFLTSW